MRFKPDSIIHRVDREYHRWYSTTTSGDLGVYNHKVLITTWKVDWDTGPGGKWRAAIIHPKNGGLQSRVYWGKRRKHATKKALAAFEQHLHEFGLTSTA